MMGKTHRFTDKTYDADREDALVVRAFPGTERAFVMGDGDMDEPSDFLFAGRSLEDYSKFLREKMKRLGRLKKMAGSATEKPYVAKSEPKPLAEDKTDELSLWLSAGESVEAYERSLKRK